jgi:hypothetical protein
MAGTLTVIAIITVHESRSGVAIRQKASEYPDSLAFAFLSLGISSTVNVARAAAVELVSSATARITKD